MEPEKSPRQQLFGIRTFRKFFNKIAGRERVLEENLDVQEAINLVRTIDSERLKKIKLSMLICGFASCVYKKPTPERVADFLDESIKEHNSALERDVFAMHEIYTDKFREKHYLDVVLIRKDNIFPEFSGCVKYVLSLK